LNRQLDARSLVLNTVTLIDATLVEAAVARPPLSEGEIFTENLQANFPQGSQKSFRAAPGFVVSVRGRLQR
jgi:hypothetical protein